MIQRQLMVLTVASNLTVRLEGSVDGGQLPSSPVPRKGLHCLWVTREVCLGTATTHHMSGVDPGLS